MDFFQEIKEVGKFKEVFNTSKLVKIVKPGFDGQDIDTFYKKLSAQVGIPLIYEEDPITGQIRPNHWTKIEYKEGEELNSYKHSNRSQPLHTDYGYFSFEIFCSFFYCVAQADFGGATTFVDVDTVVDLLKAVNPTLFKKLQKIKIHFGRKDNPLANNDDFILQEDNFGWKINWNYYRALNDTKNQKLIEDFKSFLDDNLEKSGELLEVKLAPGEAVFFHDRRVLHGRNSFYGKRQLNKGGIAKELPEEIKSLL